MMFLIDNLVNILDSNVESLADLSEIYEKIPPVQCECKALCCTLLPEMTLVEMLSALSRIRQWVPAERMLVLERMVRYFFYNPVEISSCPFLEKQRCLIYENRFFGCRAYGLWSETYYDNLSKQDKVNKSFLRDQWREMGVMLPDAVISFHLPYCHHVHPIGNHEIDDVFLSSISDRIETLSRNYAEYHVSYAREYFSDMSFFITSIFFGYTEAVQMKFQWVKHYLESDGEKKNEEIMERVYDFLE